MSSSSSTFCESKRSGEKELKEELKNSSPGWRCIKCTYFISSANGYEDCPQCGTPREYMWKCELCTTINQTILRKCAACGSVNEEIGGMLPPYPPATSSSATSSLSDLIAAISSMVVVPSSTIEHKKENDSSKTAAKVVTVKLTAEEAAAAAKAANFSLEISGKTCVLKFIDHFTSVDTTYFSVEPIALNWKIIHPDHKNAEPNEAVGSISSCLVLDNGKRTMSTLKRNVYRFENQKTLYIDEHGKKIIFTEKDGFLVPTFFLICFAPVPPWKVIKK